MLSGLKSFRPDLEGHDMRKRWFMGISYIYVLLPVALFLLGWVKWWISIPICLLMCYCIRGMLLVDVELYLPQYNRRNIIRGITILSIIAFWVYFSGVGNLVWQNTDHLARNAFYEVLVSNEWPVVKSVSYNDENQIRGLIYYIGYWLPAAVVGKLFGVTAGYYFQYVWAIIGIFMGVVFINSFLKQWSIWPVILFIIFSGLDTVGYLLSTDLIDWNYVVSFEHLEWWAGYPTYQFSSFTTQLYWVYNQAIYAWVLLALIMVQKNNMYIIFIWSAGILSCTFPFVGMAPFVIYVILKNVKAGSVGKRNRVIKEILTVGNILGGAVGLISMLYLINNTSTQESVLPSTSSIQTSVHLGYLEDSTQDLLKWILFILIEIGIYFLYIWRYHKRNPLFYSSLMALLLCTFIRIGTGGDFCMRASIPALVILYYMVAQSLKKDMEERKYICCCFILIILGVGGLTTIHEMGRSVINTINQYEEYGEIVNAVNSEEVMLKGGNFSGEVENNLFFQYLAK